ncbi:MAG: DoxX family protein [Oleispira sp.]
MSIVLSIIIGLLSVFFIFAGSVKVFAWQSMIFEVQMAFMKKYGLNRQILFLIGVVELLAAVSIWFQTSLWGVLGALAIFFTSTGALYFHFRFDGWKDGVPAMVTFTLSAIIVGSQSDLLLSYL